MFTSSTSSSGGAHVLVFPFPAQGHMLPLLDFTHQLARRGLAITILVTPNNLPILNPLLSSHPSIQTLVFPFPDHPSIPSGVENVKDIGNHGNSLLISALGKLRDRIVHWFKSHSNPPVAIISDFFLGWTHHLAQQVGIPRIGFFTSGAFLTVVMDHLWHNVESLHSSEGVVDFPNLPHSPSFSWEHLPSLFRRYTQSDPDWEFVKDSMKANSSSWACVLNTFEALDSEYMVHLKKHMGHGRVFAVGPLSLISGMDQVNRGKSNFESNDDVFTWLNGCPDDSVLYVCFGSQKLLKQEQMDALASGLEQSGIRFLWVAKSITAQQAVDGYGSVPSGFEERVSGRGMVIKGWAPQVPILIHRAVGGFLSHCGWNSVLESMVAGVMILAWPMEADQYINAKQLVEYQGAAVRICEGPDTVPDPAEFAKTIAQAMSQKVAEKMKAKKLRDDAAEAVVEGGNSYEDLNSFIRNLNQLHAKNV